MVPSRARILVINPGSTSTKLAYYEGDEERFCETQRYEAQEIAAYGGVAAQEDFRLGEVRRFLEAKGLEARDLDAVVARGGLLKPIPGGTYRVNGAILAELREARRGSHASNLGAPLAARIAEDAGGVPSFIVDPVVVDELMPQARPSGMPEIERISILHALNQKAVARRAAKEIGKDYGEALLVVAHLGGGISVGAHRRGAIVDVNNALDGDGPFSPERAGSLPAGELVKLCFSGRYTHDELRRKMV
ncbi:MAG: butyrate kinase, partial [Synergistales bacterium]|nr:butyrate kinase [Synergistales bacterium]